MFKDICKSIPDGLGDLGAGVFGVVCFMYWVYQASAPTLFCFVLAASRDSCHCRLLHLWGVTT
jgi:hypothetical protein